MNTLYFFYISYISFLAGTLFSSKENSFNFLQVFINSCNEPVNHTE